LQGLFFCLLNTGRNIAKEMREKEREKNWAEYFFYFHFFLNKLNLFLGMEIAY
jgi:hypothetical protein